MSLVSKFRKFLGHYGRELSVVSTALTTLWNSLPIPANEKAEIADAIATLETSIENIAHSAKGLTDSVLTLTDADRASIASKVTAALLKDVPNMVASALADLPNIVSAAVKAELDKATKP